MGSSADSSFLVAREIRPIVSSNTIQHRPTPRPHVEHTAANTTPTPTTRGTRASPLMICMT
ncbi:MAG: hypothetical protein NW206_20575 [Hyphomonadaceae bacterium]|nr:hypothetical protein [Hyphomonadaceae bacterium]